MSSERIQRVTLGDCGLEVCRLGCGTGTVAGGGESNQTRLGDDPFNTILCYAYDRGIRFFDSADAYGTHAHVARAMADRPRDSWQLVTKCGAVGVGPELDGLIARFADELATDTIDLLQIHCVVDADWPSQHREQMDAMAELKSRGVIRAHGVSCHSVEALEAAADEPWVDVIHARINPFGVAMDAPADRVVPVLERAHANGKGIIGMKIFGQGGLNAEQRAESLAWVSALECVDVLLVAFESPAEIDEFLAKV